MTRKNSLLLLALFATAQAFSQSNSCSCFLAKETNGKIEIEKVVIENNRVEVLSDPAIIAPVFSLGAGMNGDMVAKDRRGGMIIAQCKDQLLKLKFRAKDGTEKPFPDMNIAELKSFTIRINLTGGDGVKKAFVIDRYEQVKEDTGPVIDMFGGKVPVKPGDYLITTETKKSEKANSVSGAFYFKMDNGWMIAPITLSDGKQANFVIDLAATSSVIDKNALPSTAIINQVEMVEYKDGKETKKNISMQGATGQSATDMWLGKAILEKTKIGSFVLGDINCSVLKSFPAKLREAGIAGILGTDVLMNAGMIEVKFDNKTTGQLTFDPSVAVSTYPRRIPFSVAGGLLFADGMIGTHDIRFLLDTGARESIIGASFVKENKLKFPILDANKKISGIDGQSQQVTIVRVPSVRVGEHLFQNRPMIVGNIAAFQAFGIQSGTAILGMDFFSQFSGFLVDFKNKALLIPNAVAKL